MRHLGDGVVIREWVRFVRPENISIGNHVMIDDFVLLAGGRDQCTEIGNYVHIACFSSLSGSGGITMKDYSILAPGCRIFSESDDYVDGGLIGPMIPPALRNARIERVTLERFVCLGANCVVLPGVTIGEGATVGACSLVTADIEPWTVNVGIPAKPMKMRNRDEVLRRAEQVGG